MGIIEKDDIVILDQIRNFKVVNKEQVAIMQNFIVKYVDASVHICGHCPAQIKFAFNRILNWSNKNSDAIEAIRNEGVCITCGVELTDKRRKYCSDECKKISQNGTT